MLKIIPINSIQVDDRYRKELGPIDELAESIQQNGLITPIAVESLSENSFRLLAGERRLRACKKLGFSEIPARLYDTLSDLRQLQIELEENIQRKDMTWLEEIALKRQIHALRMEVHGPKTTKNPDDPGWSQNETAKLLGVTKAGLSMDLGLAKAMDQFPECDWSKCANKSDAWKQIKKLTQTLIRHEGAESFHENLREIEAKLNSTKTSPEKLETPEFVQQKKLVALKKKIASSYVVNDCLDGMSKLPNDFASLVEIDPPYAIDLANARRGGLEGYDQYNEISGDVYINFMRKVLTEAYRIAKPNAWLVLWFGPEPWFEPMFQLLGETGFQSRRIPALWAKPSGQSKQPLSYFANCYEMFFYARKGNPELFKPGRSNIFAHNPLPAHLKRHPTERPGSLISELIEAFTLEGQNILVPFAGSGRTMFEAFKLKRYAVGFDLSNEYKNGFLEMLETDLTVETINEMEL